ncbi:MAG: LamG-like jellyroll fold domain-containing protein [Armatimonadota bacterium]
MNRFRHLAGALLALCMILPALGKEAVLFSDNFTDASLSAWTLQAPIAGLGPIGTNGSWKAEGGRLTATGTAAPWTVQTAGDKEWADYRLSVKVTIQQPAPRTEVPIIHSEYDRYLPREWFPPGQHTGQYRFRYYAGEFDWGSDAAVYVRYRDRENCYRVQLSTEYQEMILWNGIGGYLQVAPCQLVPGNTYKLEVLAQGQHIQILLDGKKTIDYRHDCLPSPQGGIGLAAYNSTVHFAEVAVTQLTPSKAGLPAHQAKFSTRQWRGLTWVFDGNEPIALLEAIDSGAGSDYSDKVLMYHFVKLRPGYRPLYFTFIGVRKNDVKTTKILQKVKDFPVTGQGTERLTISFDGEVSDKSLSTHHTDTITFDRYRGTYRHDFNVDITFHADDTIRGLEFCDPLTYNNKEPGRGVRYPWLPAGHRWGLMREENAGITRHPISQSLNLEGQNSWYLQPGDGLWVLYPDRAVCPAFEHHVPGERTYVGVCHWGYDWHQYVSWGEKPRKIEKGTKFNIKHSFAGYTPRESEKLYLAARIAAKNDQPEGAGKPMNVLKIPSPHAFAVCDPAGTSFDQVYNTREPYNGWQFYGDYQLDREVGRTDRYAMRLDGPAKTVGMIYHHMIDNHTRRYLCTLWLKTKDVKGDVVVKLYYPWPTPGRDAVDVIDTGLSGDNDWQQIAFITTVPVCGEPTYDASEISVQITGTGTVWVDDFSLRGLDDDEVVTEHRPVKKAVVTNAHQPSADYLFYLPCNEGSGSVLTDASGRNNHAKLYQATWASTGRRSVLRLEGKYSAAFITNLSPELRVSKEGYPRDGLTLEAWVKPLAGKGGDIMGFFYSPRLYLVKSGADRMTLNLGYLFGGKWGTVTSAPFPAGEWTHVAGTIGGGKARIYVNGTMVQEQPLAEGKLTFTHFDPMVSIGTYCKFHNVDAPALQGELAELRWWARAAKDEEIAAAAAKGQP